MDLGEWLVNLWEGRYFISGCTAVFLALGGFMAWRSVPIFQTEAMLQIQAKRAGTSDAAFVKMEGLFADPPEAQAEIEILKSNKVLGGTVESLGLDVSVVPRLTPLVGAILTRGKPDEPRLEIDTFDLPNQFRGEKFSLMAMKEGGYRWSAPDGSELAIGNRVKHCISLLVDCP
jgi:tyrosine-protein kinase Etk/Wzc